MKEDIQENNGSKIRIWAKEEEEKNKNTNQNLYNVLFGALIYGLTGFSGTLPEKNEIDTTFSKPMEKIRKRYNNDASLFELGCYLFFRIDLWCVQNHYEEWRNHKLPFLINKFVSLFEKVLNTEGLSLIFDNRLDLYGKAIRGELTSVSFLGTVSRDNEKTQDILHFYLIQLIHKAADNTLPKIYKFNKKGNSLIIPICVDAFETIFIFNNIVSWEINVLPASLEAIKNSMIMDKKFANQ